MKTVVGKKIQWAVMPVRVQIPPVPQKLKLNNMEKEKEVHELFETFFLEQADQEIRNKLAEKLFDIFGFKFQDATQPETLDKQFVEFRGYNPETKKETIITVGQAE